MNKLLILSAMVLLLPIVPVLACFPDSDGILFASEPEGRSFDRSPIPMSYCESGEHGFVIVMGKCYDQDAITDYDTEEECQADEVCKAYREQQQQQKDTEPKYDSCGCPILPGADCPQEACLDESIPPLPSPRPGPILDTFEDLGLKNPDRMDDPNHGEIKGDEELEDEEEYQEEEEQGQEEQKETTAETSE